jgi:hypothetical protein
VSIFRSQRIIQVGPGLRLRGRVSSVERLILEAVGQCAPIEHVATMEDGTRLRKSWVFARAIWTSPGDRSLMDAPNTGSFGTARQPPSPRPTEPRHSSARRCSMTQIKRQACGDSPICITGKAQIVALPGPAAVANLEQPPSFLHMGAIVSR